MVLKPGDHAVADLNPDVEKLFPVTGTIAGYGESRGVGFRVETASGEEFHSDGPIHAAKLASFR